MCSRVKHQTGSPLPHLWKFGGLLLGREAGGFIAHYRGSERTRGMLSGVQRVVSDLTVRPIMLVRCPVMGRGGVGGGMVCVV